MYNLGTGHGYSVLQMVEGMKRASGRDIPYEIVGRVFLACLPHFTVLTDHHPLIPILNSHRLDEIENPRLHRLKTKIMGYAFTAEWVKGTQNSVPDALSSVRPRATG